MLGVLSIVMLLLYANEFPSLSSYAGFTFFYILFFSIGLLAILLLTLKQCLPIKKYNFALFLCFLIFTLCSMFWLFFGTHQKYKNYASLSYYIVMGHVTTLLAFNCSYLFYSVRKQIHPPKHALCKILLF